MGSESRRRIRNRRQIFGLFFFALLTAAAWFVFNSIEQSSGPGVQFVRSDGTTSPRFTLEVARSDAERARGLMFRKELDPLAGMVFIFPRTEVLSFWMKNTFIPLDMIFIDESMTVVGILESVPPLNEEPRTVERESRYVVELNSGTAKRYQIASGDTAKFTGVSIGSDSR